MNLLKRISTKKPDISRENLERDWQRNLKLIDSISAFPEEYYPKNKNLSSRSNPNLNSRSIENTANSPRRTKNTNHENKYDEEFEKSDQS
jgi:hypothetical protein